jgi:hypothetical protein
VEGGHVGKNGKMNINFTDMPQFEIIFNILVALIFIVYWVVVFVILYHLARFGIGVQPKRFAAIFLFGSVVLFCVSIIAYLSVDINSLLRLLP